MYVCCLASCGLTLLCAGPTYQADGTLDVKKELDNYVGHSRPFMDGAVHSMLKGKKLESHVLTVFVEYQPNKPGGLPFQVEPYEAALVRVHCLQGSCTAM
jgi:hypothetical protein